MPAPPPQRGASDRPLVLVVDDNEDLRDNLAEILGGEGYAVEVAETADAALRVLELADAPPAVILLDVFMPGMSARRFVSLVRDRAAWAGVRLVLVTAASERDLPVELQAEAVLRKPFRIDQLLALLPAAGDLAPRPENPRSRRGRGA